MSSGFVLDRTYLEGLSAESEELQVSLQSAQPGAGKRATINQIAKEDSTDLSSLIEYFKQLPDTRTRLAIITKLDDAVEKEFGKAFDEYITPLISATPVSTMSDEDRQQTIVRLREIKTEFEALVIAWPLLAKGNNTGDMDISDIKPPAKLTMLRGSRGPRVINEYQFVVGGVELPKAENNLKKIAARFTKTDKDGKTVVLTARDLREHGTAALKAQGIELNWKTPPAEFSFILPDGSTPFKAYKPAVDPDSDDDDDDEDVE